MKTYYYMTVDSFAMFVKSKALRFTRLDLMDDLYEAKSFCQIFNPLKYIFASCHTTDSTENIPLWKMYSSLDRGVRIELDTHNLFKLSLQPRNIPTHNHAIFEYPQYVWTSLGFAGDVNDDYIAIPCNNLAKLNDKDNDQFIVHKHIDYRDDILQYQKANISVKSYSPESETGNVNIELLNYGYQKTTYWSFQNEARFLIYTLPFCKDNNELRNLMIENRQLSHTHIFAPLSDYALKHMVVRLSPNSSEATSIIVSALLKTLGNTNIEESELKGVIR